MANVFQRLWWYLTLGAGWNTVRRTVRHSTLGELEYTGTRSQPGGHVTGLWRLARPEFAKPIWVAFPTMGDEPTPYYLDRLAAMLADLDGLFERFRAAIEPEFPKWTDQSLPADWRSVFTLDGIQLPPAPEDVDDDGPIWQVSYWCETILHWVVIHLEGDVVVDVEMAG